jgi:hypothetical protein
MLKQGNVDNMTEKNNDNVITVTIINLNGLVVRRSTIPAGDTVPSLIMHWPYAASQADVLTFGALPRWFAANPVTLLNGVRNVEQGLEYHEISSLHIADSSKFKDASSGT